VANFYDLQGRVKRAYQAVRFTSVDGTFLPALTLITEPYERKSTAVAYSYTALDEIDDTLFEPKVTEKSALERVQEIISENQ
jgi:hypothetical protein